MSTKFLRALFIMEEKLDALMVEVHSSTKELEKFSSSLNELRREMNTAQERVTKQFSKRISSSTYDSRRKGNEHKFNFNCGNEDTIDTAKSGVHEDKQQDNKS